MKKTIALILALVIALSVFAVAPITTSAAEVDSAQTGGYILSYNGEYVYRVLSDGTIEICDCLIEGSQIYYFIPSYIDKYEVTSIGYSAFGNLSCKEVHIPDTVTKIDANAFTGSSVESVVIPESVQELGLCAFYECASLKEITFENPNCKINDYSETIPSGAVIYGYPNSTAQAFAEKNNRKFMTGFLYQVLADGTAEITGYFGYETDVVIPSKIDGYTVTSIGYQAFKDRYKLTSVVIPDTVTVIDRDAFYNCANLTSIKLSDSLVCIGGGAFDECIKLAQIDLPDTLVTIDDYALSDCESLKSIEIPKSLKELGHGAFNYCTGLTEVIIPDNVTTIEGSIFYSCSSLVSAVFPKSYTVIKHETFSGCTSLKEYVLEEHITGIESYAFERCTNLEKLYIYNPDCEIYDSNYTIDENVTIYGWLNSTAHEYATKYDRKFVPLDEEEPEIVRPEKVENFHAEEITRNSFTLAWDAVEGATSYTVVNMVNGYNYKTVDKDVTSITIPNRKIGEVYRYTVIANFPDGTKMDVAKADVLELVVNAKVENVKADNVTNSSITISWDEIEGAEYIIYIGENKLDRTSDTTYIIEGRKPYTQHDIRVVAFFPGRPDYEQFLLNEATVLSVRTDKLDEITTEAYIDIPFIDEVQDVDWNAARGAYNLWILFGESPDDLNKTYRIYNLKEESYPINFLKYDTTYYYAFRYSKDGVYTTTQVYNSKTVPEPRTVFGEYDEIEVTYTDEGKAVLNWVSVDNPIEYKLYKNGKSVANIEVNKDSKITAYTLDDYKDGDKVYVRSNCEYLSGKKRFFYYKEVTLKK